MSQTGSPMLVVHSTYVQLPGRKSICRRLSGHTALDASDLLLRDILHFARSLRDDGVHDVNRSYFVSL